MLRAPAAVLRSADPVEVEALLSSGVLFKENSYISFFHETYLDHLFAEAFIADGGDLEQFLLESGQALFRRAQTRQILEFLAKTNRPRFLSFVLKLLSNDSIRSHLLDIPVALLPGGMPPGRIGRRSEPLPLEPPAGPANCSRSCLPHPGLMLPTRLATGSECWVTKTGLRW